MVLIYAPHRSERLSYVLKYVLGERLGLNFSNTDNPNQSDSDLTIEYSSEKSTNSLFIQAQGLLHPAADSQFSDFFINPLQNFENRSDKKSYPDIFSAIFYHISRLEEYSNNTDAHNRYAYQNSVLHTNKLLQTPVVDIWINHFAEFLKKEYDIECKLTQHKYEIKASIDIDSVFAYSGRGFLRHSAAILKDTLKGNLKEVTYRSSVILGIKPDPNDNFAKQKTLLGNSKAEYFIQVGRYGKFDKNIDARNTAFRQIIQNLYEEQHTIGLHPSYNSYNKLEVINKEKAILEEIIDSKVIHSRQHFLKFNLPDTYRILIESGIEHEHSMGYSEVAGFRAGTACSFPWYDVKAEKETALRIHPFCVMDVAYKQFLKMDVDACILASNNIKTLCKELNVPFTFVFHNESLSGHRGWENWDLVFKSWIDE